MNAVWSLVVVVLAIVTLVVTVVGFHELGHFSFGKLFGIRVDEFAIGFGKRVFSRQKGETTYSIRLIPLGGYVKMAGMLNHPSEADAGERNFYRASVPKRLVTLLAGVLFNVLLAGIIYSVAFMLGNPSVVSSGGPLAAAGVESGDSIIAIAGHPIDHSQHAINASVHNAVDGTAGHETTVVVMASDGTRRSVEVAPRLGAINKQVKAEPCAGETIPNGDLWITAINGKPVPFGDPVTLLKEAKTVSGTVQTAPCQGVQFTNRTLASSIGGWNSTSDTQVSWRIGVVPDAEGLPPLEAIASGWMTIPQFVTSEYEGFKELFFTPNSGGPLGANGFEGPIGIGAESVAAAQSGLKIYLGFVALISLNLALINLLPIPFLDGGKAVIVLIEGIRRRRLDPQRELAIYAAGAAFLVVFAFYVTIGDLKRIFHG